MLMPSDLDIYIDAADPTEEGDIKLVQGTAAVIDDCEDETGWTVEAGGAGVFIIESTYCMEGSGSLALLVPASTTAVILFTHASTVSLAGCNWLRFNIYKNGTYASNISLHAHFGEDSGAYTDNTMGSFTLPNPNMWYEKAWDISAITDADKTTVKYFAINIQNNSTTQYACCYLDYIYGDPGQAAIRAFGGGRVIVLYPKFYPDTYEGTTAHQTITIPRKGIPAYIETICLDAAEPPMIWMKGMGTQSMYTDGDGLIVLTAANEGIHNVIDCSFDVFGAAAGCNTNGMTYLYRVMWED